MGIFFKSKRTTKNSSDNNITINQATGNDIKTSIDLMFSFIKEMKRDIKADMKEINEQIKHTSKRIDICEGEINNLKIRVNVLEKVVDTQVSKKGKK